MALQTNNKVKYNIKNVYYAKKLMRALTENLLQFPVLFQFRLSNRERFQHFMLMA